MPYIISIEAPTPDGDEFPDEKGSPVLNGRLRTRAEAIPVTMGLQEAHEEAKRRGELWVARQDCFLTRVKVEEVG